MTEDLSALFPPFLIQARYVSWKDFLKAVRAQNASEAIAVLTALTNLEALWGRPGVAAIQQMKKNIMNGMWKVWGGGKSHRGGR